MEAIKRLLPSRSVGCFFFPLLKSAIRDLFQPYQNLLFLEEVLAKAAAKLLQTYGEKGRGGGEVGGFIKTAIYPKEMHTCL